MLFHLHLADAEKDLQLIRSRGGMGVYASASLNYQDAIFGRDSLEVAEDVLAFWPGIAREVILTLVALQGRKHNAVTEEEPGRIHHEFRRLRMDGKRIPASSERILRRLAAVWGGSETEVLYYGSVDATPLFVRLVGRYCAQEGRAILAEAVPHHGGGAVTVEESVRMALEWLEKRLEVSSLGLLEFHRSNPHGHFHQVWKDGSTSYLHVNGERANTDRPIASIEVQGLAYDALVAGCRLFADDKREIKRWQKLAKQVQITTFRKFWMPKQRYFALALDRDGKGRVRQVATLCSNPATLLDTAIFDSLEVKQKQRGLGGVVRMIYGPEFLTPVGIRCRALRHMGLVDFADYHGCWAVWTKETYDIAKGLRRQGFPRLAQQLEWRILNGVRVSGAYDEFWYVDEQGRVAYRPVEGQRIGPDCQPLAATHLPEGVQAWTISAVAAIEHYQGQPLAVDHKRWQYRLEEELLAKSPRVERVRTTAQAAKVYAHEGCFALNVQEGVARRTEFLMGNG